MLLVIVHIAQLAVEGECCRKCYWEACAVQAEAASHAGKVKDGRQALEEAASRSSRAGQV